MLLSNNTSANNKETKLTKRKHPLRLDPHPSSPLYPGVSVPIGADHRCHQFAVHFHRQHQKTGPVPDRLDQGHFLFDELNDPNGPVRFLGGVVGRPGTEQSRRTQPASFVCCQLHLGNFPLLQDEIKTDYRDKERDTGQPAYGSGSADVRIARFLGGQWDRTPHPFSRCRSARHEMGKGNGLNQFPIRGFHPGIVLLALLLPARVASGNDPVRKRIAGWQGGWREKPRAFHRAASLAQS